jgi:hypothetical protein
MPMRRNLNAGSRQKGHPHPHAGKPDRQTEGPTMTHAQSSELKALAEEAGEPDAFDEAISKAEATLRITALRAKLAHERNKRFDRFRG